MGQIVYALSIAFLVACIVRSFLDWLEATIRESNKH